MNIFYYDIEKKLSLGNARPLSRLNELLKISDTVTIHVPSTELTRNMISKDQVALMKERSLPHQRFTRRCSGL